MFNSQLNSLKSGIRNLSHEIFLNLSSNIMADSNYECNFTHKFLLTDRQILRLCKDFKNNLSANVRLSKNQIAKIVQPGTFISSSTMVRLPEK